MKPFLTYLTLIALVLTPISAVAQEENATADDERTADYSETYRQLDLFGDVFERVRAQYVEEKADPELIENAINGMLTSLDPHSADRKSVV